MKQTRGYSQIFLILGLVTIAALLAWQYPYYKELFVRGIKPAQTAGPITGQYTISAQDNGKTFSYVMTSRFTVILDKNAYPPEKLIWSPDIVLGRISDTSAPENPADALTRIEAVQPGTAVIKDNDFSVTIVVTAQ